MARANLEGSSRIQPFIFCLLAIAALYFARKILVPLALAMFLAFLLTPLVRRLEMWRLGRGPAVLIVSLISLAAVGTVAWTVANQLIDVINQLPGYQTNIEQKMRSYWGPQGGSLARATESVRELGKEFTAPEAKPAPAELPRQPSQTQKAAPPPKSGQRPLPVELVEPPPNALQSLRAMLAPLIAPIGTTVIVVVFAIIILIKREDLRSRFLRLVGQGQLNRVTQAFDDASERVTNYLRMQFLVNATFSALITIGLHIVGLPSALLWGVLAGMLRFVPYVGPIAGGSLPFAVALAVFPGWIQPLLCIGLFLVIELTVAYAIEPWLYGNHTGISSLAILVAAVFWTALWGPLGLILSTPLTVCLVVLGRHVPQLEFLYVILGDEPVLEPQAELYQRLLALDQQEARAALQRFAGGKSLLEICDAVLLPALRMAEEDRHRGALDENRETFITQTMNEFVAELSDWDGQAASESAITGVTTAVADQVPPRVFCLPAGDSADEIAGAMLGNILQLAGFPVVCFPVLVSHEEMFDQLSPRRNDVVCISALPPFALMQARSASRRLRARFPEVAIIVGLWSGSDERSNVEERLEKAFSAEVVTTLAQAVEHVRGLVQRFRSSVEYRDAAWRRAQLRTEPRP